MGRFVHGGPPARQLTGSVALNSTEPWRRANQLVDPSVADTRGSPPGKRPFIERLA